jgi:5-methylcytosine-specific restriction endonuclease McrA
MSKEYSINRPEMNTPQYKALRYAAFKRDGYACCKCGARGELELHHVKKWSTHEHLRYILGNVITLCTNCHALVTGREEEYEKEFLSILSNKKIEGKMKKGVYKGSQYEKFKRKWRPKNPNVRYG